MLRLLFIGSIEVYELESSSFRCWWCISNSTGTYLVYFTHGTWVCDYIFSLMLVLIVDLSRNLSSTIAQFFRMKYDNRLYKCTVLCVSLDISACDTHELNSSYIFVVAVQYTITCTYTHLAKLAFRGFFSKEGNLPRHVLDRHTNNLFLSFFFLKKIQDIFGAKK